MKKQIGTLAAIALSMAGATQAAVPQQQDNKQNVVTQAKDVNRQKKVVQSRAIDINPFSGGLDYNFYDRGRSPKEYGQYLQSRGLQKWNKRK